MFEKVNPSHPDKIADRIAGAIVDMAYKQQENPKIAVEVLIGHSLCSIITESSLIFERKSIEDIVTRISGVKCDLMLSQNKQDTHLAENQTESIKCGDNGIFKGTFMSLEEKKLARVVGIIHSQYPYDGKYIINGNKVIACQSHVNSAMFKKELKEQFSRISTRKYDFIVNPLGEWSGGINVDTGATNRKLGSDMGRSITGGGLHGKDFSKADVSVNIFCHLLAQELKTEITAFCAIGDEEVLVNNKLIKYETIVKSAKDFVDKIGGFEELAKYGLII